LNIKNGLNFAQFLEGILRISYMKLRDGNEELGFKAVLSNIFQDASLEIKNRAVSDDLIVEFYSAEVQ
jgi:hypothetical protein